MKAYRQYVTVEDPQKIILENTPFQPGDRLEVLLISQEESDASIVERMEALFRQFQSLPQAQHLTDEEIIAEIAAYRNEN
jgi:transcription elongation factor